MFMLELSCPLDSTCYLEAARDCKQGKTEYLEIVSEFQRVGVTCSYDTLELIVLGHYLPSSLSSLKNCVNCILDEEKFLKSDCKRILQLAATVSISSSRTIFLARNCPEWSEDTWHFYLDLYYVFFVYLLKLFPCHTHLQGNSSPCVVLCVRGRTSLYCIAVTHAVFITNNVLSEHTDY